ncbi:hypothetical protein LHGZ1_0482 [Laribacter hongkongensis]|uniref:Uncharacterized protein n=1 Tax=Laribacter hongkongensis TaxID=168471 RepID=A0A248LGK0_9NEIS|nr:hypothetical protein LHGZ1_0482 [Laribacter hongkongensis]
MYQHSWGRCWEWRIWCRKWQNCFSIVLSGQMLAYSCHCVVILENCCFVSVGDTNESSAFYRVLNEKNAC